MMYPDAPGCDSPRTFPAIALAAMPVRRTEQPVLPSAEGRARPDPKLTRGPAVIKMCSIPPALSLPTAVPMDMNCARNVQFWLALSGRYALIAAVEDVELKRGDA
jgi:hypothetical protein